MCFSATANFVGAGVLGTLGVATMTQVRQKRELMFAALPTLFAVHQFIEGFVWLGMEGHLPAAVAHDMGAAFMLYAQGLLPAVIPLSIILFERSATRRRRMLPLGVLGVGLTLYTLWALAAFPTEVSIRGHSLVYLNRATDNLPVAILYLIATCGALFFSKEPEMVWFGAANLLIVVVTLAVKQYAFTSVWCAYAALASLMILGYFWRQRGAVPFVHVHA